jgi:hypothetical protein
MCRLRGHFFKGICAMHFSLLRMKAISDLNVWYLYALYKMYFLFLLIKVNFFFFEKKKNVKYFLLYTYSENTSKCTNY